MLSIVVPERVSTCNMIHPAVNGAISEDCRRAMDPNIRLREPCDRYVVAARFEVTSEHRPAKPGEYLESVGDEVVKLGIGEKSIGTRR